MTKAIDMQVGRYYQWADPMNEDRYLGIVAQSIAYSSRFKTLGDSFEVPSDYTVEGDRWVFVKGYDWHNDPEWGYHIPADWIVDLIE